MPWSALRCALIAVLVCSLAFPEVSPDEQKVLARKNWWSFRPPVRPAVPAVTDAWVRTPVDAFLLTALREKGLRPSPALGRAKLIRRLTLDLHGLPPTPEEVRAFEQDKSPNAYEKLVDRLMASPHYGERWGLKWLDVVRYADTNGFELDAERPHAWRYRDYVIQAFNDDKPFDRFLQEQLAGDEIAPGDKQALVALGFYRAGPQHVVGGNLDLEQNRQEFLIEVTHAIGAGFLGLTMNCARCHNHKFDPILQADYYRLQAIFGNVEDKEIDIATKAEKDAYEKARMEHEAKLGPIKKAIAEIEKPFKDALKEEKKARLEPLFAAALAKPKEQRNEEEKRLAKEAESQIGSTWDEVLERIPADLKAKRKKLREQMHEINLDEPPPAPKAYAIGQLEKEAPTHILKVGDHKMKLAAVEAGLPTVLANGAAVPKVGRRKALAEWLASPQHPLTARVMANRIWQLRMGRGLVRTMNDFGALGERPTNPKLLDWLATEFVAGGWSVKKLDKLILLSAAYQQTSTPHEAGVKADPENKLYWRAHQRRLDSEFVRDQVLAVTGRLHPQAGGPPVKTPIEPELYELIFTEGEPDNLWPLPRDKRQFDRRGIYLLNKRSIRLPMLANFDQPDAMSSCPSRPVSTHALQSLSLLNSDFIQEQSRHFGQRLRTEAPGNEVARAYALALARAPQPAEVKLAKDFFAKGGTLEEFCLALLNRNEFLYVP